MTTTVSPPIQEAPGDAGAGRVMQTPEIEPLTIAPEDQARNVVEIHRRRLNSRLARAEITPPG